MKQLTFAAAAALLTSTAIVHAGGIERTTQSVGMIFEEGSYAEFALSFVAPSVSGVDPTPGQNPTGDMANNYFGLSGGYKTDIGDKMALAVIFDQPFGVDSEYPPGSYYGGVNATLDANAVTLLGSYDVSDRFVVYGGGVAQTISANAAVPIVAGYSTNLDGDTGFGYVAGAAFQIPEYALRVALTYRSEISTDHVTSEGFGVPPAPTGSTNITTPQSVNLEFQTGINPKTLVFGSVRWVEWSQFSIAPPSYPLNPLVSYQDDRIGYSLGVGRKLSDTLSAAATIGYERTLPGAASILSPTSGYFSLGGGVTYSLGDAEITAGLKYLWLGDVVDSNGGVFENNTALAAGIKVSIAM